MITASSKSKSTQKSKPKSTQVSQEILLTPFFPLRGVSWSTYQALMTDVGENRPWRIAYNQEILEIRMPLLQHELPKGLLESFIEATADELEVEVMKAGALRLEREDLKRAMEPDSCFYIQNEAKVRGKKEIDLTVDPPPDLAIESDYTNSSLNKFSIYASLGVPELWRYYEGNLEVYQLVGEEYEKKDESLAFPSLPVGEVGELIEVSKTEGQRYAVRLLKKRIRTAP